MSYSRSSEPSTFVSKLPAKYAFASKLLYVKLDGVKEIKLQGKFQLSNNRRFRELAGNASGCSCDCALCVAPVTNYLTPFMDTMLCKRENDSAHYRLGCVLGKCPKCRWDKVLTVRVEPLG